MKFYRDRVVIYWNRSVDNSESDFAVVMVVLYDERSGVHRYPLIIIAALALVSTNPFWWTYKCIESREALIVELEGLASMIRVYVL